MPRPSPIAQSAPPPSSGDDIVDIVDPLWTASSIPWTWIVLLSLLLLAAAFAFAYFARRHATRGKAPASPEERAYQRIDSLAARRGSLAPNRCAFELSEALKDFLAEKFKDPVRYETSQEFLRRAASGDSALPDAAKDGLRQFLERSEEVKFGSPADAEARLEPLEELARRTIRLSTLVGQAK